MTTRRKILVARIGAMGDICMLAPVVSALSRGFEVHWLVREKYRAVLERFPALDCKPISVVVTSNERAPFSAELVRRLAEENYDCLIDFSHWPAVTWLAEQLSAIPVRAVTVDAPQDALLGIAVDAERQAKTFNCLVPVPRSIHQHEKWRLLIKAALGVEIEPEWNLPPVRALPTDQPLRIFLHPHAGKPEKIWPAAQFARLISRASRQRAVYCAINQADRRILRQIRWRLFLSPPKVEAVPLDPSFRGLQEALENSDIAIGCDSGPMHFASLMGVPTLVIYGQFPALEFSPPWRTTAVSPPRPEMPASAVSLEGVEKAFDDMTNALYNAEAGPADG